MKFKRLVLFTACAMFLFVINVSADTQGITSVVFVGSQITELLLSGDKCLVLMPSPPILVADPLQVCRELKFA